MLPTMSACDTTAQPCWTTPSVLRQPPGTVTRTGADQAGTPSGTHFVAETWIRYVCPGSSERNVVLEVPQMEKVPHTGLGATAGPQPATAAAPPAAPDPHPDSAASQYATVYSHIATGTICHRTLTESAATAARLSTGADAGALPGWHDARAYPSAVSRGWNASRTAGWLNEGPFCAGGRTTGPDGPPIPGSDTSRNRGRYTRAS